MAWHFEDTVFSHLSPEDSSWMAWSSFLSHSLLLSPFASFPMLFLCWKLGRFLSAGKMGCSHSLRLLDIHMVMVLYHVVFSTILALESLSSSSILCKNSSPRSLGPRSCSSSLLHRPKPKWQKWVTALYDTGSSHVWKTCISNPLFQLLRQATAIMLNSRQRQQGAVAQPDTSQLLLIVSDGRGLFLEGVETVKAAVRQAREARVFVVFVIIDSPNNKVSLIPVVTQSIWT